jgi:hypothetical protein
MSDEVKKTKWYDTRGGIAGLTAIAMLLIFLVIYFMFFNKNEVSANKKKEVTEVQIDKDEPVTHGQLETFREDMKKDMQEVMKSMTQNVEKDQVKKESASQKEQVEEVVDPYNGGLPVPDNIPQDILTSKGKNKSGMLYWDDKQLTARYFIEVAEINATKKKCDGGGVRGNPEPQIEGDCQNMPGWSEMEIVEIEGVQCYVGDIVTLAKNGSKRYVCIYLGNSIRGNWDKHQLDND